MLPFCSGKFNKRLGLKFRALLDIVCGALNLLYESIIDINLEFRYNINLLIKVNASS